MNDTPENTDQPEEPSRRLRADEPEPAAPDREQIMPPPPITAAPAMAGPTPRRQRTSCLLRFLVILSLFLGLASLALSGFLLYSLNNARRVAIDSLEAALEALEGVESKGFHYEYQLSETLPIDVEIPVQQDMMIPVQGNFAVNTDVRVPIDAGVLGTFVLNVPIDTSVPLDVEVPVQISQTVPISTSIPVRLTVPIDITAEDPAVQQFIDSLRRWLLELRDSFDINALLPLTGNM